MTTPKYTTPYTPEELREVFRYDPKTGFLYWRHPRQGLRKDMRADGQTQDKYRIVTYLGVTMNAHRVIWAMVKGKWPEGMLDHADRDSQNNRMENLRDAAHRDNHLNAGPRFGRPYKGIQKKGQRWRALVEIGTFDTPEEAAKAYDMAVAKLFGKFAYRNFP
jgi:hypothetical protein